MAVNNLFSGVLTNRDASPRVINNSAAAKGELKAFAGTVETVATDDIASTYRLATVPSNCVMHSLRLYSDDIGATAAAVDVGIYRTTADGSAVVDADVFASAVLLHAGALNGVDILHESAVTAWGLEDMEKPLWQALGLTSDPCVDYDIVLTATGAIDAAVTVGIKGSYAI